MTSRPVPEHPKLRQLEEILGLSVVEWVREECARLSESCASPPVDPVRIAQEEGVLVTYDEAPVSAAALALDSRGEPRIQVGTGPGGRVRWDIAHELVHLLLLRTFAKLGREGSRPTVQAVQEIERLCNFGASEMLIPRRLYTGPQGVEEVSLEVAKAIGRAFRVTQIIALHRIVQGMDQVMMITFQDSPDRRFRVVDTFPKPPILAPPRTWTGLSARPGRFRPNLVEKLSARPGEISGVVRFKQFGDLSGDYSAKAISLLEPVDPVQGDAFAGRANLGRQPQRVVLIVDLSSGGVARTPSTTDVQLRLQLGT